jgi:hypothetical protein
MDDDDLRALRLLELMTHLKEGRHVPYVFCSLCAVLFPHNPQPDALWWHLHHQGSCTVDTCQTCHSAMADILRTDRLTVGTLQ